LLTSILQPSHLILILVVALLVLGPKRLPDAGRALGQGLREFRDSIGGRESDEKPPELSGDLPPGGAGRGS
jgi:sec-independent protein translocase protein TatA